MRQDGEHGCRDEGRAQRGAGQEEGKGRPISHVSVEDDPGGEAEDLEQQPRRQKQSKSRRVVSVPEADGGRDEDSEGGEDHSIALSRGAVVEEAPQHGAVT